MIIIHRSQSMNSYETEEDSSLNIAAPGLLENDSDQDGNLLTAVKVTDPANGTLNLNTDGSFTYTPDENYFGADSFTYKANDGTWDSDVAAAVMITVKAVNDPPTVNISAPAYGSSFSKDDSISFTGTASDVEDGNLTASLSWSSNLDGSIGTGNSFSTSILSVGTHTITAIVNDFGALEGSDQVVITVTDNDAPTLLSIVRADTNPSSGASVDFTMTFIEAVSGVNITDFSLTTTGNVTDASVSSVIDTGDQIVYLVSVNTGSGNGTIRLDVVDDDSIVDGVGNPLGGIGSGNGDFTSGEVYDIVFKSWYGSATITSNQSVVAVSRPHVGNEVLTYNGFASGSTNAYVPMLFKDAFGGSYNSALYIQNVDDTNTANITIHFYDNSGVETHSMADSLSPLASKGYWLPSISSLGTSWVGGVKVVSDHDIVAVGRPHIGDQVLSYNGFASGSTNAYVPMLFKDAFGGSYNSALYIQNVDPSNTANITIRFYDSSGTETYSMPDTLPPLASKGYWLPAIAPLGSSWVGGVKVESDQDIVAVGRPHVGSQILTYNGFTSGALNAYVPMMFKDAFGGSYDSALYVQNLDSTNTANITIRFYDNSGTETYSTTDSISALASKGYWLPAIAPLETSWVGGVKVESDHDIVAIGRPHIGSQVMAYNGFVSGSTNAYVPMLFRDAFGGSYDSALYVQNIDPSNTADVTIQFFDTNGDLSCTVNDTIPALSTLGYWIPSVTCDP